jgi:hypothetical protein
MRALVIAICLAAGAANAGESGVTVRQLAGISASVSDSGFGLGAQLGVRISPLSPGDLRRRTLIGISLLSCAAGCSAIAAAFW